MIAAQGHARQFLAAPDLFSVAQVKRIHLHVLAADIDRIAPCVDGWTAQQRTAGGAGPLGLASRCVDGVELCVTTSDDDQIFVNYWRIPNGCSGLNRPRERPIVRVDRINLSVRRAKEDV